MLERVPAIAIKKRASCCDPIYPGLAFVIRYQILCSASG